MGVILLLLTLGWREIPNIQGIVPTYKRIEIVWYRGDAENPGEWIVELRRSWQQPPSIYFADTFLEILRIIEFPPPEPDGA